MDARCCLLAIIGVDAKPRSRSAGTAFSPTKRKALGGALARAPMVLRHRSLWVRAKQATHRLVSHTRCCHGPASCSCTKKKFMHGLSSDLTADNNSKGRCLCVSFSGK